MLAPLVVLTPVSIVVLVMSQQFWVIAAAALVTLANSAGSVGDLASAAVLWHLPDGELIYHNKERRRNTTYRRRDTRRARSGVRFYPPNSLR